MTRSSSWRRFEADRASDKAAAKARGCTCEFEGAFRRTETQAGCPIHDWRLDPRFKQEAAS